MRSRKAVAVACMSLLPFSAMAAGENNIGSCGWGSKLFDGQNGVGPQVLGATTNGTSGNQTFGVTSGTSGCTQDGAVKSSWKTAMFIDGNKEKLARDMSLGQGETLDSLAKVMGVREEDKAAFFLATRENLGRIFANENASTDQILVSLKEVLVENRVLARYSAAI